MTIQLDDIRLSDSPYIDRVTYGRTLAAGFAIRPAEVNWHMVVVKYQGNTELRIPGPYATSGVVTFPAGAEILWIRFKVGVYMPHLLTRQLLDNEMTLPNASDNTFWLHSTVWQFPNYENVDTFVQHLMHEEILTVEPTVNAMLNGEQPDISPRTLRHRFLQTTGVSQNHIYQIHRAQQAAALLRAGVPILDTIEQTGYYDQPHLTRYLKKLIGYTPAQILIDSDS
ncbi:MAG: helix-turn-helix domain-containing protein [Chloroflexota bacterium]